MREKSNFTFYIVILIFAFCILKLNLNSYASDRIGQEIELYVGQAHILSVNKPSRIVIGNPNIADVTHVTKNEMTISPKAAGKTTLVVWDNLGEQSYSLKVYEEDINELKQRVDNLLQKLELPEVYSRAEQDEGKVVLLGRVKTHQDIERIAFALAGLKEKILDLIKVKEEESIVEIDLEVLELSKDATDTLGFTWPSSLTISTDQAAGAATAGTTPARWSTLFKITNWSRTNFQWTLDALVQEGKARILSRPRLACQSGKEAELLVGGEKPIFTTTVAATTGAAGTSIEYKEFGIKLKIKPTVTEVDRLKLGLKVEVSEVGTADVIGPANAPTAKAFPLSKRTAYTELFLNDGQTMAIGGLMKQKNEEDIRKMPWLGDVPILGLFFRKKITKVGGGTGERGDTELFITLTPKIIGERKEAVELEVKPEVKPETEAEFEVKDEIAAQPEASIPTAGIEKLPLSSAGYAEIIQKRILEGLNYPASAKDSGFQGTVKLSLHLSYTGELLEVLVKESSGHTILDDHTLSVAHRNSPYPPFPPSIEQKELWLDIPILYQLD